MGYTPSFTPQYENGWENLPSENSPITAEALNAYDDAIENIEDYLADNEIVEIEANPTETATGSLTKINIGGQIYEIEGGGGGSDVSITPTLSTGTKIADFEIDGVEGELYAPTGGGGNANIWTGTQAEYEAQASQIADGTQVNITDDEEHTQVFDVYSTDEQVIGIWIDGSTLYRRVIDLGADTNISNSQWTASGITITNLDKIVYVGSNNSSGTFYPLQAYHTNGAINLMACRDGNPASSRWIILEYTKTV